QDETQSHPQSVSSKKTVIHPINYEHKGKTKNYIQAVVQSSGYSSSRILAESCCHLKDNTQKTDCSYKNHQSPGYLGPVDSIQRDSRLDRISHIQDSGFFRFFRFHTCHSVFFYLFFQMPSQFFLYKTSGLFTPNLLQQCL